MADKEADTIHNLFQQYLGRNANDGELEGFRQAIRSNVMDPIGLGLFLQSSSEYAQKQGPGQAAGYAAALQNIPGYDDSISRGRGYKAAQASFAENGRQDSSGLASAYAGVDAQLAEQHRNQTYGQAAGYLGNLMNNSIIGGGQGANTYNQNYGAVRQQGYQVAQNQWNAAQDNLSYGRAYHQAQQNQPYEFAGAALGGLGKLGGGLAAGGYF